MKDSTTHTKTVQAVVPAVKTGTGAGATVDTLGFGSLMFAIQTGAIAGSGNFTATIEESDTTADLDFDDVDAADLIGTLPAALAENATYRIGYRGAKRFVRIVLTKNSGTSIAVGASAILGHPHLAPVA